MLAFGAVLHRRLGTGKPSIAGFASFACPHPSSCEPSSGGRRLSLNVSGRNGASGFSFGDLYTPRVERDWLRVTGQRTSG